MASPRLELLPCLDDEARAADLRRRLQIDHDHAARLGREAVAIARAGDYVTPSGRRVDIAPHVAAAVAAKASIPPGHPLADPPAPTGTTRVQVAQASTLEASRALVGEGLRTLALNFANGVRPGGGFLGGALAQEESLCRSSALYETLLGDPMYDAHAERRSHDSTDWCIVSPDVPVFRTEEGDLLDAPWTVSFLTCAAPVAQVVGVDAATRMLASRIPRVLDVARAHRFGGLVLGAWGCGAFGNDPVAVARLFREALEARAGSFSRVVFAISDWSRERRFLGPFRDAFAP